MTTLPPIPQTSRKRERRPLPIHLHRRLRPHPHLRHARTCACTCARAHTRTCAHTCTCTCARACARPCACACAPVTNVAPSVTGSPASSVAAGMAYNFQPVASDPNGDTLTYSINGRPSWATFSTTSGALTGTPAAAQVGTYSGIVITVSDGKASKSLAAFSISVVQPGGGVGSATLSWAAPIQNTDGSAITDLGGYVIYHGLSPSALTNTVRISNPGVSTYVIDNLSAGTHYFALAAFNTSGVESAQSGVGSKDIL